MIVQIMKREFAMLYRSRAMRLSTVVMVLLILAAGVLGKFLLGGDDDAPATGGPVVAVEDQMADYVSHVKKVSGGQIDVETIGNGEAENYLRERSESDADGPAVVLAGQPGTPDLVTATDGMTGADQQLSAVVNTAATAWLMEDRGITLSDDDYSTLVSTVSVPVSVVTIGTANLIESDPIGYISSFVGLMVLFMMIMMGISTIANGVVEEKSSRVVEIVLTTVRPRTLLLGKILGIGTFLLLQFVLFAIAVVISLNLAGLWLDLGLGSYLAWLAVWLVLGFFFYAMATGALAATASRQEDLGAVTSPISMTLLIPFYVGLFLVPAMPEATVTKVLSMVPGISPFAMPVRQAYDTVTTSELLIAAALGVVAIPLVAAIAGKIYENSILHTGRRLKITEAIRAKN
ncbi:ABC transporter permease [Trueperella sp.]|uniref:ABC transporter permease n=1 Tax=Trueperella sp. TaxID=2699835 RepID=UPI003735494B